MAEEKKGEKSEPPKKPAGGGIMAQVSGRPVNKTRGGKASDGSVVFSDDEKPKKDQ